MRLSTLLFGLCAFLVIAYSVGIDRSFLIDQSNYIDNFTSGPKLDWLTALFAEGQSPVGLIIRLFSEELGWQIWTALIGSLFEPTTAVLFTVCVLNLLMIFATWRVAQPAVSLALWIVLPLGLATVGLLQLRQGFAFAVMLFSATYVRRPLAGTLIAATIHTTFALAFIFVVISWFFRSRQAIALLVAVALAFGGAYAGGILFEIFGGRRVLTYSTSEGATSINYVFGALITALPSVYWLLTFTTEQGADFNHRVIAALAVVHVGIAAFVIFSFFMFPLGAGRIGYLTILSLIVMLPSLALKPRTLPGVGVTGCTTLYLLYLVGKSYSEGTYDILLNG